MENDIIRNQYLNWISMALLTRQVGDSRVEYSRLSNQLEVGEMGNEPGHLWGLKIIV